MPTLKSRPKHRKLARLVEHRLSNLDTRYVKYFRNSTNTIAVLDEMGLLRPGLGKKNPLPR